MGNLWRSLFGVEEHPFATYFDVHQGYWAANPKDFGWCPFSFLGQPSQNKTNVFDTSTSQKKVGGNLNE